MMTKEVDFQCLKLAIFRNSLDLKMAAKALEKSATDTIVIRGRHTLPFVKASQE